MGISTPFTDEACVQVDEKCGADRCRSESHKKQSRSKENMPTAQAEFVEQLLRQKKYDQGSNSTAGHRVAGTQFPRKSGGYIAANFYLVPFSIHFDSTIVLSVRFRQKPALRSHPPGNRLTQTPTAEEGLRRFPRPSVTWKHETRPSVISTPNER